MRYELAFWPQADATLAALEVEPSRAAAAAAANRLLDRLEIDPWDRRLGNTMFRTADYSNVVATDVRQDRWHVLWKPGPEPGVIDVVAIAQLP